MRPLRKIFKVSLHGASKRGETRKRGNMKIQSKLTLALGVLCLFVIVSGSVGIIYTQSISSKLNIVTRQTTPLVETIDDMIILLLQGDKVLEEISTEQDKKKISTLAAQFQALDKSYRKAESIAANLITDPQLSKKFNDASEQKQVFTAAAEEIIVSKVGEGSSQKFASLEEEANQHIKTAVNTLEEISIRAYIFNKDANEKSVQAVEATVFFLSLTTLLSLITAVLIGWYLSRLLIKPINTLSDAALNLSRGHFDVSLSQPSSRNDEIAHLTTVFDKMIKSLQKMIKQSPSLKRYIDLSVEKRQAVQREYNLSSRSMYLIKDPLPHRAYEIFLAYTKRGEEGLCMTRDDPEEVQEKYGLEEVEWVWMTEATTKKYPTAVKLSILLKKIADFTAKHQNSVILIDRIDYLIAKHGFEAVMKFIASCTDTILTAKATALIPIDPHCISLQSLALLEKELKELPLPTEKAQVSDELLKILAFIKNRKALNRPVSFKEVSKEFSITAPTTKKKLQELQQQDLIRILKQGRKKLLEPTPLGERQDHT